MKLISHIKLLLGIAVCYGVEMPQPSWGRNSPKDMVIALVIGSG